MNNRHTCNRLYSILTLSLLISSTSIAGPIHDAAKSNNLTEIKNILKTDIDKDVKDEAGFSALHYAAQGGKFGIVEALINAGANKDIQNNNRETPLHLAASAGKINTVKMLLRLGVNKDAINYYGYSPLHKAVQSTKMNVAVELLKQGANPNTSFGWFWTDSPLKTAINNNHQGLIKLLLFYQGCRGGLQSVQQFIEREGGINRRDHTGKTLLHHAAQQGQEGIVDFLFTKNPNINARDNEQNSVLHLAAEQQKTTTIQKILDKNPQINLRNNKGQTALHIAAKKGRNANAQKLIHAGANKNAQDNHGKTALHIAVEKGMESTVRALLKAGVNPYIRDHQYKISLGYAKKKKIKQLLKNKANELKINDFIGLDNIITLCRGIIQSVKQQDNSDPDSLENLILLYGPPGTGKTMLAKILGEEAGYNFIEVASATLGSKYMSETSQNVYAKFAEAQKNAPSILFFDEIDSLIRKKTNRADSASRDMEDTVNMFLTEINKVGSGKKKVLVIGATNHKNNLDPAFLSRCQQKIMVPLPREVDRKRILQKFCSKVPYLKIDDRYLQELVKKTRGFAGRDLKNLVSGAKRIAERNALEVQGQGNTLSIMVEKQHLEYSLAEQKRSLFDEATFAGDYEIDSDSESDDEPELLARCLNRLNRSFGITIPQDNESSSSNSHSTSTSTSNPKVDMVDLLGKTPFHYCAHFKCKTAMKHLLGSKKNSSNSDAIERALMTQDKIGDTPIHTAIKKKSKTIVRYLLKHNPSMGITNNEGKIPLALAQRQTKIHDYLTKQMKKPLFKNLIGHENLQEKIQDIQNYFQEPELFNQLNVQAPLGLLLCGPPGTGKTQAIRALAYQCNATFINKNGTELQTPEDIRDFFAKARRVGPCIVFIDEMDSIATIRIPGNIHHNRMVNQLLIELEGFDQSDSPIIFIGATNHKNNLDQAVTSRFSGNIVNVERPNTLNRRKILDLYTKMHPFSRIQNSQLLFNLAASTSHEFAGRSLGNLVKATKYHTIRTYRKNIKLQSNISPLVSKDTEYIGSLAESLKAKMATDSERSTLINQLPSYIISQEQQQRLLNKTRGLALGVIAKLMQKLKYQANLQHPNHITDDAIEGAEEYQQNLEIEVNENKVKAVLMPFNNDIISDDIEVFAKLSSGLTKGIIYKFVNALKKHASNSKDPLSKHSFYKEVANILEYPDPRTRYHLIEEGLNEIGLSGVPKNLISMLVEATEEYHAKDIIGVLFKKIRESRQSLVPDRVIDGLAESLNDVSGINEKPLILPNDVFNAMRKSLERLPHTIAASDLTIISKDLRGLTSNALNKTLFHALHHSNNHPLTIQTLKRSFNQRYGYSWALSERDSDSDDSDDE